MNFLEPLTLALALSGWITYKEKEPALSIMLFSLSALTKEIGLVFPASLASGSLLRGKSLNAIGIALGSKLPCLA